VDSWHFIRALFLLQFIVRLVTGDPTIPKQVRILERERAELKAAIGGPGAGGSYVSMAALAGDQIDIEALRKKFGAETSVERLREMYAERRTFVRGIFGKSYLAHQDANEDEETKA